MAGKHDQIAGALIHDILGGRYRVSERLPSERDLANRFDANRGAVREAMKKLEFIGLAEIQPGGARVRPTQEASLDVIGHMLGATELPDAGLLDQVLVVISALLAVGAEQVAQTARDDQIEHIRTLTRPFFTQTLDDEAHTLARFELFQSIMLTSENLPLQLIARTLFEQFKPSMTILYRGGALNHEAFSMFAEQLDAALASRDLPAVHKTFSALSDMNRKAVITALKQAQTQGQTQVQGEAPAHSVATAQVATKQEEHRKEASRI